MFGANAQVALEKFARYFDVEARMVPVSVESRYCLDPKKALEYIDENTIGMFVIMGSTYTGHFEPVEEMSKLLDDLQERTGIDVPIHVDGASGAFVAPFAFPDHHWSFDVSRVVSINASGHKFGLSYPGVGWVLWRGRDFLPKDLIFELHYLGGVEETYTLNFSRPACFVISQYYSFIRFGQMGYAQIMNTCLYNARLLSAALESTGIFDVLSDIHRPRGVKGFHDNEWSQTQQLFIKESEKEYDLHDASQNSPFNSGLPVVSFRISDQYMKEHPRLDQDSLSAVLRIRDWIVPNYELPRDCDEVKIFRVVVKETMTEDLVDTFTHDILWAVDTLNKFSEKEEAAFINIQRPPIDTIPNLAKHLTRLSLDDSISTGLPQQQQHPSSSDQSADKHATTARLIDRTTGLYDHIVKKYSKHTGNIEEHKKKSHGSGKDVFSHAC